MKRRREESHGSKGEGPKATGACSTGACLDKTDSKPKPGFYLSGLAVQIDDPTTGETSQTSIQLDRFAKVSKVFRALLDSTDLSDLKLECSGGMAVYTEIVRMIYQPNETIGPQSPCITKDPSLGVFLHCYAFALRYEMDTIIEKCYAYLVQLDSEAFCFMVGRWCGHPDHVVIDRPFAKIHRLYAQRYFKWSSSSRTMAAWQDAARFARKHMIDAGLKRDVMESVIYEWNALYSQNLSKFKADGETIARNTTNHFLNLKGHVPWIALSSPQVQSLIRLYSRVVLHLPTILWCFSDTMYVAECWMRCRLDDPDEKNSAAILEKTPYNSHLWYPTFATLCRAYARWPERVRAPLVWTLLFDTGRIDLDLEFDIDVLRNNQVPLQLILEHFMRGSSQWEEVNSREQHFPRFFAQCDAAIYQHPALDNGARFLLPRRTAESRRLFVKGMQWAWIQGDRDAFLKFWGLCRLHEGDSSNDGFRFAGNLLIVHNQFKRDLDTNRFLVFEYLGMDLGPHQVEEIRNWLIDHPRRVYDLIWRPWITTNKQLFGPIGTVEFFMNQTKLEFENPHNRNPWREWMSNISNFLWNVGDGEDGQVFEIALIFEYDVETAAALRTAQANRSRNDDPCVKWNLEHAESHPKYLAGWTPIQRVNASQGRLLMDGSLIQVNWVCTRPLGTFCDPNCLQHDLGGKFVTQTQITKEKDLLNPHYLLLRRLENPIDKWF